MEESPVFPKQWKRGMNTIDMVYPNKYYGGVYSLAPLIIYNIVNSREGWLCKRVFLDRGKITSKLVGFTFQYELDYYNFISMLKKSGIGMDKKKREHIIFAGGPCVNTNPMPLSKYIDFFFLGDCEETIQKVLDAYDEGLGKKGFLEKISSIKGIFVPGAAKDPTPAFVEDFDSAPYPLYQPFPPETSKDFVFGKVFMLEIERGCPFSCKFCLMPAFYKRVKFRSLGRIKEVIDKGIALNKRGKVVIYSASFSHPEGKKILKHLLGKKLKFSVPSIKIENMDVEMLNLVREGGQRTLTVAPEANERLRVKLGKFESDEKFLKFAERTYRIGFDSIKYYFMIGIPGQGRKDLKEMVTFIKRLKEIHPRTYVSINPFVPKPKTALARHKFDKKKIKEQASFLKKELSRIKVKFKLPSISSSYKQWKLAHAKDF